MIKVYINGEWVMTFETQEQYNNWFQSLDVDWINSHSFEIYYD